MTSGRNIITALATPPGRSALAIVRVSGPGAISLVSRLIPELVDIGPEQARRLVHGFAIDSNDRPLDEITAIPYFAPKSYTGEEMVEIVCHGGQASSRAIIDRLTDLGARIAEPGEFTRRAFLNGRISLSEAEAVAAAIDAKSELALKAAARNLKGELYEKIDNIRNNIRNLLTLIEAEIDFSEEEIDKTPFDEIAVEIAGQLECAREILKSYDFGRGLNSGYKIAIVGRANVGKSSLLNALLARERAIVTDMPGTTRDTLTEWITIAGFPILLTDTAGLRESADMIEILGQERTRGEIEISDLVIFMLDGTSGATTEDSEIFRNLSDKPKLIAVNKIDLIEKSVIDLPGQFPNPVFISAKRGDGLDDLRRRIVEHLHLENFSLDTALLATERQFLAMKKAEETLSQSLLEIKAKPQAETISVYLRETLDYLGELVGETTTDDILNDIFGKFCIGK
jgi:tRNA modification GTPase